MGKIDLPLRELLQFPTLLQLRINHPVHEFHEIGICHRNGEVLTIVKEGDEWKLLKPLSSIFEDARRQHGKQTISSDRNIIVYYSLDPPGLICSPGANHILAINYIDIIRHREMITLPATQN
jgi:hypothetical protein